jgi:small-conductance mechanosensitive channel
MQTLSEFLRQLKATLDFTLIQIGKIDITLWLVLYFTVSIFLLFYLSAKFKALLVKKVFVRHIAHLGTRQAIGSIIRYVVVFFGPIIILQSAGIDLTSLTVLAGALGVGIGFGLQNITNNFVSGIVILFERPVKEGDRIEVGDTHGRVMKISPRATTILTNDNIAIIVPNSDFITKQVINWSYNDDKVRFKIPVNVAYGTDLRKVEKLLLEVAAECEDVLEDPAPHVRVSKFGDSGIEMQLVPWTKTMMQVQGRFRSTMNFAIAEKFRDHGITIPFPQRDVHLKSGFPDGTDKNA